MSEKILLVDDDLNLLSAMQRQLSRSFQVEVASSGQDALEKLAQGGPYAVLLTDLHMPGMNGIALLERAQEVAPDTVRIVLSGHADLERLMQAINEGYIFRFLTKPSRTEELSTALMAALEQHRRVLAARELHGLKRLQQALESVVLGFTRLVEARDPYTAGHQERVCQLAVAMGARLGLNKDQAACVRVAAMIHDLGKVYVPTEFLNRPGRLSEAEMGIIRTHPQVGYEILKPLDFHWPVSEIVLQHHERLDGTGYPRGLKGEEVLFEARIISVADVVEAMASHRPYRPSRGLEGALEEIERYQGTHFDPRVVEVCLNLFNQEGWTFQRGEQWQVPPPV